MVTIKVAIISDIHGNSVALKEVLKDAKFNNVDEYIFSGDLVNDLPFGNETLEMVEVYSHVMFPGLNKEKKWTALCELPAFFFWFYIVLWHVCHSICI